MSNHGNYVFEAMKQLAFEAVVEAGKIVEKYFYEDIGREEKSRGDYVTKADTEAEGYIVKRIKCQFPASHIIAEESGKSGDFNQDDYYWLIDPVDGTNNFTRGIPSFHTLICIAKGNRPVFIVCYHPITKQLYWAEKGQGAYHGKKKMKVSEVLELEDTTCAFGLLRNSGHLDQLFDVYRSAFFDFKRAIRTGSISVTVIAMARGLVDANIANEVLPHDLGVLSLMVEEAGGEATTISGEDITLDMNPDTITVLSNGKLHDKLLKYTRQTILEGEVAKNVDDKGDSS